MGTALAQHLERPHLPALDGLRAVAVGVVIAYHLGLPISGDLGATGFFVLSGFLITRLLLAELDGTGGIDLGRFYLRRSVRIFPAYFVFLAGSALLDALRGDPWPGQLILAGALYTVNYYNAFQGHEGPIAHAWSLAVEEQFYLLWPIGLLLLWRLPRPWLGPALGVLVLGAMAWRSWCFLGLGLPPRYVYNAFETRMDALALGCLLAVLLGLERWCLAAEGVARRSWWPLITVALLGISRGLGSRSYHYSIGFTVDAALLALLLAQLLVLAGRPGWAWLDWGPVRWLGRISYPLYLWHLLGTGLGRRLPGPGWLEAVAGVLVSIGLAAGSWYLIERPALRLRGQGPAPVTLVRG
jgi:peptidoglycan/LPS O-acetylase OafA/YrhL